MYHKGLWQDESYLMFPLAKWRKEQTEPYKIYDNNKHREVTGISQERSRLKVMLRSWNKVSEITQMKFSKINFQV